MDKILNMHNYMYIFLSSKVIATEVKRIACVWYVPYRQCGNNCVNTYFGFIVCLKHRKKRIAVSIKIAKTAKTVIAAVAPVLKPLSSASAVSVIIEIHNYSSVVTVWYMYPHLVHKLYNIRQW